MIFHEKNFDGWNDDKQHVHKQITKKIFPKIRQIWYVKLGVNIGFEADGKKEFTRPVLILAKIGSLFWCVPLTTKNKENKYHYKLKTAQFKHPKESIIMLSQARILDLNRFEECIGLVPKQEFNTIQKELKKMYFPVPS